jgi:FO synthase
MSSDATTKKQIVEIEQGAGRNVPSPVVPKAREQDAGEGQGGGESQTLDVGVPPTPDPSPSCRRHASGMGGGGSSGGCGKRRSSIRCPTIRAILRRAENGTRLADEEALALAHCDDLAGLMALAERLAIAGHGHRVSFSRKVFIPLTRLCRDVCHYCTFAQPPRPGERPYLSPEQVLAIARAGQAAGCKEALFTLGDRPERRYAAARSALADLGAESTLAYLEASAGLVLRETGLLPHLNAGVMTGDWLQRLRAVSVSQGIMLETTAERLSRRGGPHFGSPDKAPGVRLATLEAAGRARVPFTTGLLIGIGETRAERIETLLAIRGLHERHGHIQEVIVQNFRAKPGTRMADAPEPALEDHLWTVAVARIVLGPEMNIQAPPNLRPDGLAQLVKAGINDWGGVSPVTPDHVNPEAPWPHLDVLERATEHAGRTLIERLAIYPEFLQRNPSSKLRQGAGRSVPSPVVPKAREQDAGEGQGGGESQTSDVGVPPTPDPSPSCRRHASGMGGGESERRKWGGESSRGCGDRLPWLDPAVQSLALRHQDAQGFAREDGWAPGTAELLPAPLVARIRSGEPRRGASRDVEEILQRAASGDPLTEAEIARLFEARGPEFSAVCRAADRLRQARCGEVVTYVVNRNINYTNVCTYGCGFCAFSKGRRSFQSREQPYDLGLEGIARRTREAWERGATEVCLQGGIRPGYTGETYLSIVGAVKSAAPAIHMHAFSPLEVWHGAETLGLPLRQYLARLKAAGLSSLPGTAAEILDDEVRAVLCPDKIKTGQWLEVMEAAHAVGLKSTATIMFGHVDGYRHWARHLMRVRALQERTGGFTEFVPLPFVHMEAPIYLRGRARKGPTFREAVLMHAVARLVLDPLITNVQASWVKMGPDGAALCLEAGANDMGGVLMNESITRAAGAVHGQEMSARNLERIMTAAGRTPRQRTTGYGAAPSRAEIGSGTAAAADATISGSRPTSNTS